MKSTKSLVLGVLADGKPRTRKEIMVETGLSDGAVGGVLMRCWKDGILLRTDVPIHRHTKTFRGRAGMRLNMRNFYLYMLRSEGVDSLNLHGRMFVKFEEK